MNQQVVGEKAAQNLINVFKLKFPSGLSEERTSDLCLNEEVMDKLIIDSNTKGLKPPHLISGHHIN